MEAEASRDKERSAIPNEGLVWVLQTKVDILTDNLGDIKDTIKRIEKMVGVIRVVEANSKQLNKDLDILTLRAIAKDVEVEKADDRLEGKIKTVAENLETFRASWSEKWNVARGMWIVISAVFLAVSSGSLLFIRAQNTKLENAYTWIEREKIERSVRETREIRETGYAKDSPAVAREPPTAKPPPYRTSSVTPAPYKKSP